MNAVYHPWYVFPIVDICCFWIKYLQNKRDNVLTMLYFLRCQLPRQPDPRLSLLVYNYSNVEEALAGCFRERHRAILVFAWWVTRPLVADLIVVGLTKSLSRRLGGSVLLAPSLLWPPKSLRAWEGDPFYSHFITLLKTQTCIYNSCTYIKIFSA